MAAKLATIRFRRLCLVLLCAVASWLAPTAAGAGDLAERIPVAAGGTLKVELDRGSVEIHSHDAAEIRIRARARGLGASSVHFSIDTRGKDVTLTGSHEAWTDWMTVGPTVSVRAWVPRERAVEVRTSGGGIEIAGVSGAVRAETSGGSIRTRFLRVPSGRVETRGGAIEVAFPASAGAQLDAAAEGGRVYVEHGVRSLATADPGRVVGAVNGGGPTLRLRATGGDINVRRP